MFPQDTLKGRYNNFYDLKITSQNNGEPKQMFPIHC